MVYITGLRKRNLPVRNYGIDEKEKWKVYHNAKKMETALLKSSGKQQQQQQKASLLKKKEKYILKIYVHTDVRID